MSKFKVAIHRHNGVPTVFVNDRPKFVAAPYPKAEFPYAGGKKTEHPLASDIYCIRIEGIDKASPQRSDPTKLESLPLNRDGSADIRMVSDVVDRFLAWRPDSLFILRTYNRAPIWWLDEHPDEEMRFDKEVRHLPGYEDYREVSVASQKWSEAVCRFYEDFCAKLHKKYEGRIIEYQFAAGSQGENGPIGSPTNDSRWFCNDFSPAMQAYFREWLKNKYQTTSALRHAWGDENVDFETAAIPDRIERMRSEWFTFRSPLRAQTADFYSAYSDRVEENVISICSAIKRATNRESLTGSHLGAIMDQGLHAYVLHMAMTAGFLKAANHPDVDTFTTPSSYVNRGPGGDCTPMVPLGSLQLRGKYRLQDQDTIMSTVFSHGEMTREQEMLYYAYYKLPRNISQSIDLLKRDFGHAIIRGYGMWIHPLRPGLYDHPEIADTISKLKTLGEKSLNFPRGVDAQMAVITDSQSVAHQQCANRLSYPLMYHQRQHFWSRTGAGWDIFVHEDLGHPSMRHYPVYLFLNTFYLTDEDVRRIEKSIRGSNATVIWTYAPGIQSPSGFDLKRVERLTGFHVRAIDIEALPRITITNYEHPYTRGLGSGTASQGSAFSFGIIAHIGSPDISTNDERDGIMGPIIYVDDPEAIVLGELDCLREPGFCVKPMDGWTSVYVSAPMLTAQILRNILQASGAHLYTSTDDVFYPGKGFLMMHTHRAGQKEFHLPHATDVYDCWNDRIIGRNIDHFTEELPEMSTALYYVGDMKKW